MKAKNISVAITESNGELKVWGVSFNVKGKLPKADGKVEEKGRRFKEKQLVKFLETIDFPEYLFE